MDVVEESVPSAFSTPTTEKSNINVDNKKVNFFIGFDRLALLPGHPVTGMVYVSIKEKIIIKKIGLNWFGLESVSWFQGVFQSDNCKNLRWWVKERSILFPEAGQSEQAVEFAPGTYKYPFSFDLPAELPGSFEDERSWTKVVFDDKFGLKTLDSSRMSFIRYTCSAFITEQNNLDGDALMITAEPDSKSHIVSKDFRVSELYDPSILLSPARLKLCEESFLGSPLQVILSIANDGNLLLGSPLHGRIDIQNNTNFTISSMKLSILEKKNFTCLGPEGSVELFTRTTDIYSVDVKDGSVPANTSMDKIFKLTPPKDEKWGPSVLGGANITLTHEICLQIFIMATMVEVTQPIRIVEYSSFFSKTFPRVIPHTIEVPDFKKLFSAYRAQTKGISSSDFDKIMEDSGSNKPENTSTTTTESTGAWSLSDWFGPVATPTNTNTDTTQPDANSPLSPRARFQTKTEEQNSSWFNSWFTKEAEEKPYGQDGQTEYLT